MQKFFCCDGHMTFCYMHFPEEPVTSLQGRTDVYDLGGRKQVSAGENSDNERSCLRHGIYVSDGRKFVVK